MSDIGTTSELSLRVSVATLARILFENPRDGELMLALERKATVHETESGRVIEVKSQPFGGAIRIQNLRIMHDLIGNFHFDSESSRSEQDFRIFIRPSDWAIVREVCIQHLNYATDPILETDPGRELVEEFADALKINLTPEQYISKPVATAVEDEAVPTENIRAKGMSTVRVYRIFEARIIDTSLTHTMMTNSESFSYEDLSELALDAKNGGKRRANSILVLPLKRLMDAYLALSPKERNAPVLFEKNLLDETVPVVLDDITVPKYQRL